MYTPSQIFVKWEEIMYIVMIGAPGSGKGTAAKILAKELNLPHISTGDIFREQIKENTNLGIEASKYISKGILVPDDITIEIFKNRLAKDDVKNGGILDGFPRTMAQVKALDEMLAKVNKKVDLVIELKIPDDVIVQRILNREVCSNKECGAIYNSKFKPSKVPGICDICGSKLVARVDDTEESIKKRIKIYYENLGGMIEYYREKNILYSIVPEDPTSDKASEQAVNSVLQKINNK